MSLLGKNILNYELYRTSQLQNSASSCIYLSRMLLAHKGPRNDKASGKRKLKRKEKIIWTGDRFVPIRESQEVKVDERVLGNIQHIHYEPKIVIFGASQISLFTSLKLEETLVLGHS